MESENLYNKETVGEVCQNQPLNLNQSPSERTAYSEIPSQKWNGNNIFNNSVTVDYVNKRVDFEPMLHTKPWKMYAISYSAAFLLACLINLIVTVAFIGLGLNYVIGWAIYYLLIGIEAAIIPFFYLNKYFLKNVYPKFNYGNQLLLSFGRGKRQRLINPDAIIDNKYIIPCFGNVILEYSTTEDFSKYIEKVEIKNLFKDDAFKWYAVFYFKEKPVLGQMKVAWM